MQAGTRFTNGMKKMQTVDILTILTPITITHVVQLILSLASGHLSPRFHVIFNDQFDSVWDGSLDKKLR